MRYLRLACILRSLPCGAQNVVREINYTVWFSKDCGGQFNTDCGVKKKKHVLNFSPGFGTIAAVIRRWCWGQISCREKDRISSVLVHLFEMPEKHIIRPQDVLFVICWRKLRRPVISNFKSLKNQLKCEKQTFGLVSYRSIDNLHFNPMSSHVNLIYCPQIWFVTFFHAAALKNIIKYSA